MATYRFNHNTTPISFAGVSDGMVKIIENVNDKLVKGHTLSYFTEDYLGGMLFGLTDEEKDSVKATEREWLVEQVKERAIDARQEGWNVMEEAGAVKAEIFFTGGNDEGGAEQITLTLGDGSQREVEPYSHGRDENSLDGRLAELLTIPVYDEYGGFAGEFQVEGTLLWDYAEKTVVMDGDESQYESHSISKEV
jgi:hypothetical protein